MLEYIVSGKGYVICADKEYVVEENDVYLIHPGMKHRYGSDEIKPYEKIWINFFSGVFTDIISAYGLSNRVVFKAANCKELFADLLNLAKNYSDNEEIYLSASEILFKIILKLVANCEKQNISTVAILLTKTRISIKEISDSLCFADEYHFSNLFKKKNGISPSAYRKAKQ